MTVLTQHAERGGAERQARREQAGVDPDPGAGEETEQVAVGKEQHGPVGFEAGVDHVLRAGGDLVDGLAFGGAVLPQVPVGALGDQIGGQAAF